MDKFREECGVFGVYGHTEAANLTYLGLYALQHRGQESVGIAASDGERLQVAQSGRLRGRQLRGGDVRPARRHERHRARAVLHGRGERPQERPADPDRLRPRRNRHRPQRQSRQRPGTARPPGVAGIDLPDDERHRGPAAPVRAIQGGDGRGRADRVRDAGTGRVLARAAHQGPVDCGARSARLPAR